MTYSLTGKPGPATNWYPSSGRHWPGTI